MHTRRLSITWLGHSTFLLVSPGGCHILFDPWLATNPACPASHKKVTRADLILITHGHGDHTGDAVAVGRATGATMVGPYELGQWLLRQGITHVSSMNHGGTQRLKGIEISMVAAVHSSSVEDESGQAIYLGEPSGYVLRLEDGQTLYFAGDTALFGDMRLIREMYAPEIAFLPIGDLYTMGPEGAARASEMLGVKQVVPMHYGTFPALTGTPARLRELLKGLPIEVLELRPGETVS